MSPEEILKIAGDIAAPYGYRVEFLGDAHSVGVQGDGRVYAPVLVLIGSFTDWDIVGEISQRITNETKVSRVTYEIVRK